MLLFQKSEAFFGPLEPLPLPCHFLTNGEALQNVESGFIFLACSSSSSTLVATLWSFSNSEASRHHINQKRSPEISDRSGLQLPKDVRQLRGYMSKIIHLQ